MMYNLGTLIKYEYKKLLHRRSVWVVTLSLTALTLVSVVLPPFMTSVSIEDSLNYIGTLPRFQRNWFRADLCEMACSCSKLQEVDRLRERVALHP